jgi:hypothetical protein
MIELLSFFKNAAQLSPPGLTTKPFVINFEQDNLIFWVERDDDLLEDDVNYYDC